MFTDIDQIAKEAQEELILFKTSIKNQLQMRRAEIFILLGVRFIDENNIEDTVPDSIIYHGRKFSLLSIKTGLKRMEQKIYIIEEALSSLKSAKYSEAAFWIEMLIDEINTTAKLKRELFYKVMEKTKNFLDCVSSYAQA